MKFNYFVCLLIVILFRIKSVLLNATTKNEIGTNGIIEAQQFVQLYTPESDVSNEEYKVFEMFKYFVYPRQYNQPSTDEDNQRPHYNATRSNEVDVASARESEAVEPAAIEFYPLATLEDGRYYPPSAPYNFGAGMSGGGAGPGLINIADPLFLMATLAFVAFLINSILGLVDRLNPASPVVRARRQWTKSNAMTLGEETNGTVYVDRQRNFNGLAGDFIHEMEASLKMAMERFERNFSDRVQKRFV